MIQNDNKIKLDGSFHKIILQPPTFDYYKTHTFENFFDEFVFEKFSSSSKNTTVFPRKTITLLEIQSLEKELKNLFDEKDKLENESNKFNKVDTHSIQSRLKELESSLTNYRKQKDSVLTEINSLNDELSEINRKMYDQKSRAFAKQKKTVELKIEEKRKLVKQIELEADTVVAEKTRNQSHLDSLKTSNIGYFEKIKKDLTLVDTTISEKLKLIKENITSDFDTSKTLESLKREDINQLFEKYKTCFKGDVSSTFKEVLSNTVDSIILDRNTQFTDFSNFLSTMYKKLLNTYPKIVSTEYIGVQIINFIHGQEIVFDIAEMYRVFSDVLYLCTLNFLKKRYSINIIYRVFSILTAQVLNTQVYIRNQ